MHGIPRAALRRTPMSLLSVGRTCQGDKSLRCARKKISSFWVGRGRRSLLSVTTKLHCIVQMVKQMDFKRNNEEFYDNVSFVTCHVYYLVPTSEQLPLEGGGQLLQLRAGMRQVERQLFPDVSFSLFILWMFRRDSNCQAVVNVLDKEQQLSGRTLVNFLTVLLRAQNSHLS